MVDVYQKCPILESEKYILRLIKEEDAKDLLAVYGDERTLPFFNSDGCTGNTFYCETEENVLQAIRGWLGEYKNQGFVRWSIIDKTLAKVIGTIEGFHRAAADKLGGTGLLRIDVGYDYENKKDILEIIHLITEPSYEFFKCEHIITKAMPYAKERIEALRQAGYQLSEEKLIGHDGTEYSDYWVKKRTDS